ncbi:MAG TPA: AAA family ATPase [Burkholderiales bacterium]|nr:AAA family ATPase [Burkholderiales bacterium]
MYLEHFGLKEPPFRITPHTDFFFQGANRGATLEALLYAITHDEGIVKVSGEVGSGKTMLCRVLMERLPATVETIYLANPSLSRDEILYAIGDELKLQLENDRPTRVLRSLQEHLLHLFAQGRRVVVLIDEAHAMPDDTLEEIRLLSNLESNRHKLLQIVLFGQPELDEHLDTAGMRQLKERVTHSFRLEPLVRGDIENYVDFRMRAAGYRGPKVFTREAIRLIARTSQGLTRRINILADKALLAAYAAGTHAVTAAEVKRAVRDSEFYRARSGTQKISIGAAALTAGLILGWAIHVLLSNGAPPRPQASAATVPSTPVRPDSRIVPVPPAAAATPVPPAVPASDSSFTPSASDKPEPARLATHAPASPGLAGSGTAAAMLVAPAPSATDLKPLPAVAGVAPERKPVAPARGELARERFEATQTWLRGAPGDWYVIQLATVSDGELPQLEDFLRKTAATLPVSELFVYSVKIDGRQHYRVAYGTYPSAAKAFDAMKGLPQILAAYQPYARSVERMRSQNRQ